MGIPIEELRYECERVRNAARCVYEEKTISHFCIAEFPKGWCGCLSRVLGAELSRKYPAEDFHYVCGELYYSNGDWTSHAWVRYKDWILDITADQFPEINEPIVITHTSDSMFHAKFQITNEHPAARNITQDYEERTILLKKYEMEKEHAS